MKSTMIQTVQTVTKPTTGDLLINTCVEIGDDYVVMVTSYPVKGKDFSGVVVYAPESLLEDIPVGRFSNTFDKDSFTAFQGEIILKS